jgi:hypothetical protein
LGRASIAGCPDSIPDYPLENFGAFSDYLEFAWDLVDWYVDEQDAVPMHAMAIAAVTQPRVYTGLMNCGGGVVPILGEFEQCPGDPIWWGKIDFPQVPITPPQAWQTYVQGKSWPRPSGFGYTGDDP